MTDTPTPLSMTPEQRAKLVDWLMIPCAETSDMDATNMEAAADQLEADGLALAAAQDRAYHLAVAIMGGEDAPGLADSLPTEMLEILARSNFQRHSEDIDRLAAAQAEIARLTAALDTAREDGMREAMRIAKTIEETLRQGYAVTSANAVGEVYTSIESAITKGATT